MTKSNLTNSNITQSFSKKIILASNNQGKITEFNALFNALNINIVSQNEYKIPSIEETGLSFVENAILKARHAAALSGLPAIADDSGLEVDYLNGSPGIYSARFAQIESKLMPDLEINSDHANNQHLLKMLENVPKAQRSARFRCVLVYMRHKDDPSPIIADGAIDGIILDAPHGDNGFGYDPLFYLPDLGLSMAQINPALKNTISHRALALKELMFKIQELKYNH